MTKFLCQTNKITAWERRGFYYRQQVALPRLVSATAQPLIVRGSTNNHRCWIGAIYIKYIIYSYPPPPRFYVSNQSVFNRKSLPKQHNMCLKCVIRYLVFLALITWHWKTHKLVSSDSSFNYVRQCCDILQIPYRKESEKSDGRQCKKEYLRKSYISNRRESGMLLKQIQYQTMDKNFGPSLLDRPTARVNSIERWAECKWKGMSDIDFA